MGKKLIMLCLALMLAFSLSMVDTTETTIVTKEHIVEPCCDLGNAA